MPDLSNPELVMFLYWIMGILTIFLFGMAFIEYFFDQKIEGTIAKVVIFQLGCIAIVSIGVLWPIMTIGYLLYASFKHRKKACDFLFKRKKR